MDDAIECRSCGKALTHTFVDLGDHPLSNAYLLASEVATEKKYPLHVLVCEACFLVQVPSVVSREVIFTADYAYFSSFSASWVEHAKRYAIESIDRLTLDNHSLVVEVASNDGYLLRHFLERNIPVLGIEPTLETAQAARKLGIPVITEFFGADLAGRLTKEGKQADLLVGNNVLAHVPDLNDFISGVQQVLKPTGVASFEFPHLLRMIEHVEFDTIYHEHFSYFSLISIEQAMHRNGLTVFDVEELSTHGGSLRLWVCNETAAQPVSANVSAVRNAEIALGLNHLSGYNGFAERVNTCRSSLISFLDSASRNGKRVAAYGAAAKGNTLLNYCGVTTDHIPYVVDRNPHKQGKLLPGSHIPIRDPDYLLTDQPDFILILPWNLKSEIVAQLAEAKQWGAQFVTPIPVIEILS